MLFCRNKDCFGPAHSGALCPACAEDEAHSSPTIASEEAVPSAKESLAALQRIEEEITRILAENDALKAEVAELKRRAWGWSLGIVPLADPGAYGGEFFHVRPDDVRHFIRQRYEAYGNWPSLDHFAYSIGDHGCLRVRVLDDGDWRSRRGV